MDLKVSPSISFQALSGRSVSCAILPTDLIEQGKITIKARCNGNSNATKHNSEPCLCVGNRTWGQAVRKKPPVWEQQPFVPWGFFAAMLWYSKLQSAKAAAGSCSHQLCPRGSQEWTQLSRREDSSLKT